MIPDLFGKPQKYATFLDQEISFQTKQPLLVVMYNGYGVRGLPPKSLRALASVPKPAGRASNDLATAAMNAVQKMADAAGHPLAGEQSSSSSGARQLRPADRPARRGGRARPRWRWPS